MTQGFSTYLDAIPNSGIREFFDLVLNAGDIISLGVGEPDFLTPWVIREEAIYALEKGYTTYSSNWGILELRKEISQYFQDRFSLSYSPDNEILVTNGVSEAVDLTLRTLLNPDDEVILPQPAFVCYDPLVRLIGAVPVPIDTSQSSFIPDPDAIEAAITDKTKLLVLCYPSNPTGVGIPKDTLQRLADIAEKYDLWVISDEIYAELSFGEPFRSFANFDGMQKRTVVFNGFSKSHAMTGWRIGYMCGPADLVAHACKIHQYSAMCVSTPAQYAAIEALKNGWDDVKAMCKSYEQRCRMFVKGLNKVGLNTQMPDGALYCFPSIQATGLSSIEFATALLKEEKVAVVPGNAFGVGGEGYVRCCFASPVEDLRRALTRIERFVATHG